MGETSTCPTHEEGGAKKDPTYDEQMEGKKNISIYIYKRKIE